MISFTTVHVFCVTLHNYNGVKIPVKNRSKNSEMDFNMILYQFRGILLNHFVCGIFTFPKITASPRSISYSEPAELEIRVTVHGEEISGVLVNISVPGVSGEMSTRTGSNGIALFVFTPPTTGEIKIDIENRLIELKIPVTLWKLYIETQPEINEGDDFIVTIRNGTASGPGLADATIKFN